MAGAFSTSRGSGVLLFDEDFDLPPPSRGLEPEVIEPLFTLAELKAAREEAAHESREAAISEAGSFAHAAASQALTAIATQITAARAEAAAIAEQSSEAVVRLLLDCFATAFPALSVRHGAGEAAAMLREVLPTLHREPKITVRINPHIVAAITEEIQSLDADLAAHVTLIPTDAMAQGDVRATWENGTAARDTVSLWNQIEAILAPAGLLNTKHTVKEPELVE
jgi:flagellar biosynthesis/type III secretory pathway protein FliH